MNIVRDSNPMMFFSKQEKEYITSAIRHAEMQTSGEIRVHLERFIKDDVYEHAKKVFEKLNMTNTDQRNGVLILLGLKNKKLAVIGDEGINQIVVDNFWDSIVEKMITCFKEDRFADGIVDGIIEIGDKLKRYFPYQENDINELPDEISFSV